MKPVHAIGLAGLVTLSGVLGACSDEKKGAPIEMSEPAPPEDPNRPVGQKPEPPAPTEKPSEKF